MELWEKELKSTKKNNNHIKAKGIGILFSLIGILASLFLIRFSFVTSDYEMIDRSDAVVYEGKYEKYIHDTQGRSDAYYIVLNDDTALRVPIERQSLRDTINDIQKGQDVTILAHPKSQIILALSVDGNSIIDFDESQEYMQKDSQAFDWYFWIGVILFSSIVVYNLVGIVVRITKNKK